MLGKVKWAEWTGTPDILNSPRMDSRRWLRASRFAESSPLRRPGRIFWQPSLRAGLAERQQRNEVKWQKGAKSAKFRPLEERFLAEPQRKQRDPATGTSIATPEPQAKEAGLPEAKR